MDMQPCTDGDKLQLKACNQNKITLTMENKKAQEEIIGFMVIVVMVIVIGLLFMFFLKPKAPAAQESQQVSNLLISISHATSACDKEIRDVAVMCMNSENCNNENACDYLNKELPSLIDKALNKGGLGNVIGYSLVINGTSIDINHGNKTATMSGAVAPITSDLKMELKFYYP